MTVPFWRPDAAGLQAAIDAVPPGALLDSGEVTARFERAIAERLGVRFATGVTSGTTAIAVALVGVGVERGDEVVVPPFGGAASAARALGATPVLVDVEEARLTIDPAAVARAVTPRTRAIVAVHANGRAADLDALPPGIPVVEDATFGSRWRGRPLGTIGAAGCFSLALTRVLTTGSGGIVVTDDPAIHERVRSFGQDRHPIVGSRFKLTSLQAAVGLAQIPRLDARLARMRSLASMYLEGGLNVSRPAEEELCPWAELRVEARDALVAALAARGIACRPFPAPLVNLPVASRVAAQGVWLPSGFMLSDAEVARVIEAAINVRGGR